MTAGMAFEALNNAGVPHNGRMADVLVVLNDNDMSISPPVGALNRYLARLMSGALLCAAREGPSGFCAMRPLFELARSWKSMPGHGRASHHFESSGSTMWAPSMGMTSIP